MDMTWGDAFNLIKHLVISINLFLVLAYQVLFCSIGTEWDAINHLFASPQDPQLKRESFSVMIMNLFINLQKQSSNKSYEFVVYMNKNIFKRRHVTA